jgi:hypothetical protein
VGDVVNEFLAGCCDLASSIELDFAILAFDFLGGDLLNKAGVFKLLKSGANDVP